MLKAILDWFGGGIIKQFTDPLLAAYQAKLNATNDADRLRAERDIQAITAARDIAVTEAGRAWSATSVGRWLIVVPWGIYWAAGILIQLINPWFGLHLIVVALPPGWDDTAMVLIPAIVIADAGTFAARTIGKR
jgi:hypothetical protein